MPVGGAGGNRVAGEVVSEHLGFLAVGRGIGSEEPGKMRRIQGEIHWWTP